MSRFKIAQSYYEPEVKGIFCILKSQEYGRTYASYLQKKLKNDETYRRICKAIRPVNHYYFVTIQVLTTKTQKTPRNKVFILEFFSQFMKIF